MQYVSINWFFMFEHFKKKKKIHLKLVTEKKEQANKVSKTNRTPLTNQDNNILWSYNFWIFELQIPRLYINPISILKNLISLKKILVIIISFLAMGTIVGAVGSSSTAVYENYSTNILALSLIRDDLYDKCSKDINYDKKNKKKYEETKVDYNKGITKMITSFSYPMIPIVFGHDIELEKLNVTDAVVDFKPALQSCAKILKQNPDSLHIPYRKVNNHMIKSIRFKRILQFLTAFK